MDWQANGIRTVKMYKAVDCHTSMGTKATSPKSRIDGLEIMCDSADSNSNKGGE